MGGISRLTLRGLAWALISISGPAMADEVDLSLRQAVIEANQAIRGEILRSVATKNAVTQAIASYVQQRLLQKEAVKLKEALTQPSNLCQDMEMRGTYASTATTAKTQVLRNQAQAKKRLTANTSTAATLDSAYAASNQRFCTQADAALGICKMTNDPSWTGLAGADRDALYLFQSKSGAPTYEGRRNGPQAVAADSYITRVVYGSAPPEQLRGSGHYQETPQARAYVELLRRYEAFLSMSAYSLHQVKESRNPAK